jgi:hypothetical protein
MKHLSSNTAFNLLGIVFMLAAGMLLSSFPALRPQNWIWIVLVTIGVVVFVTFRILIHRARD